jgi:hypothetical protein
MASLPRAVRILLVSGRSSWVRCGESASRRRARIAVELLDLADALAPKDAAAGAATSVLLAASPLVEGVGGRYFEDCNESHPVARRPTDFSGAYAQYALSPVNAERIWEFALDLIDRALPG